MKPRIPHLPGPGTSLRVRAAAGAALIAGAGAVIAGCAGGASPGLSGSAAIARPATGALPPRAEPGLATGGESHLAGLPASQSIIWTATVTLRSRDVSRSAALATQLATAAGGYVASENTSLSPGHPGRSTIYLTLKVPVSAYQPALTALSSGRFGTQLSLTRHAQDVTQTVADVNSRVASAQAAIAQLRALLARAGSVASLLDVQNQISQQESDLESLQAQQRALSGQVSYATVSVLLEGKPAAARHRRPATGFTAGLAAGWRAFTRVIVALLTALGAALPFLVALGALGFGGYRAWRWRLGRRPRPGTAG